VGDVITAFDGAYATGPDVGTGPDDMVTIAERTPYAFCRPVPAGGSADRYGATWTSPQNCLTAEVDVLVPAALGGLLTAQSVPALRCAVIAGPANNQLDAPATADQLHERGILWAPDVVVSAGGIIHATAIELHHETRHRPPPGCAASPTRLPASWTPRTPPAPPRPPRPGTAPSSGSGRAAATQLSWPGDWPCTTSRSPGCRAC
jgi:glutamate dehydrogenase/leucine dehydrogenase